MNNAIIYTFSGTGNTARLANLYAEEFEKNGIATEIYKISDNLNDIPSPNGYAYVGIAYPIHAFNAPKIVLEFAKKLPKVENKKLFIVKTSGEPVKLNNVSSGKMMRTLKRKGYVLTNEYHYVMPYNMIFRHTDAMAVKMWDTAKRLAPIEAREVLTGVPHKLSHFPFGSVIAWVFRIEHPAMKINGRFFNVDEKKCVKCGKCVKACSLGNVTMDEHGKITFGNKCVCCVGCSFTCPTNAISIGMLNSWKVNGAYDMENQTLSGDYLSIKYCHKAYERYFNDAASKIGQN